MGFGTFTRDARIKIDDRRFRLVKKTEDGDWLLEDLSDGSPSMKSEKRLLDLLCKFRMTFDFGKSDAAWAPVVVRHFTPQQRALIKLRLSFVRAVQGVPITEGKWQEKINDTWNALKNEKVRTLEGLDDPEMRHVFERSWRKLLRSRKRFGWISVYRWARRFYDHGEDEAFLLDKNRGCRDRDDMYGPIVLGLCDQAINERYLIRERGTVYSTWEAAKLWVEDEQRRLDEEYERTLKEQQAADPFVKPPERIKLLTPPRRLIQRLIHEIPAFDRYAARYGMDAAVRHFRFVIGRDLPSQPLEEIQLDHTVLDLFVIDDETGLPLGRPWITVCLDTRTRCILGLYIGFCNPSGLSIAHCLKDAFLPKLYYASLYPEIENEMPFGIGRSIKWDNGLEEHSQQAIEGCGRVGVRKIIYCPRRRPWYKAEIERFLRTLNEEISHQTPGTTFRNIFEKGDYNPKKLATIRLSTVRLGIRKWVADVYHQRPHRTLDIAPMALWNKEIRPDLRRVPSDAKFLDAVMGRRYERTLRHDAIKMHNLVYTSDALRHLLIQDGPKLDVEISVNEENLGKIYVFWKDEIIEAEVEANSFAYANGLTLWQHQQFQKYQRQKNLQEGVAGWQQAKEEVRQIFLYDLTAKFGGRSMARHVDAGETADIAAVTDSPSEQQQMELNQQAADLYEQPKPVRSEIPSFVLPRKKTS
jgi:putative transposase